MAASLPNPSFNSAISRLPASKRTYWLDKLSRNANTPGAGMKQVKGRGRQGASRIRSSLGIYLIESTFTGAKAASVGGATPATITVEAGTPASTVVALDELDPVTWVAAGTRNLTVSINTNEVLGNAKVIVT